MNKEFVTYEQALALKELGFDEPCWAWWHIEDCDTRFCYSEQRSPIINSRETEVVGLPTYSQAFRWFREKHNLFSEIQMDRTTEPKFCFVIFKYEHFGNYEKVAVDEWYLYRTYEEAEQVCLTKLIEITNAEIKNRS